jgi:hypothetical protein
MVRKYISVVSIRSAKFHLQSGLVIVLYSAIRCSVLTPWMGAGFG